MPFIAAKRMGLGMSEPLSEAYRSKASARFPSASRRSAQISDASATAALVGPFVFPKADLQFLRRRNAANVTQSRGSRTGEVTSGPSIILTRA